MRRTVVICAALVACLAGSLSLAVGGTRIAAATTTSSSEKVAYCDRTTSLVKPYRLVTSAPDSIVAEGHGSHTGPVFPAFGPDGQWGDIIPPFDYDNGQQHFAGLNWPGGSAVLDAACAEKQTT